MLSTTKPSSNWFALQKTLVRHGRPRKLRKIDHGESSVSPTSGGTSSVPPELDSQNEGIDLETTEVKNGESIAALRKMVLGKVKYTTKSQTTPGKYLALDCEMVGVGTEGSESSLARVSIVNYTGAIILDVFVRQREKVVDYRTQWSGIRSSDLAGSAKPFKEVQKTVAELIKDRILIGHAIYNDLKALLLSQPSPQIRDTQSLAYKYRTVKSRHPALRVLIKQELGVIIQGGEHSSVTDARATMALFRLHKKQWESGFRSSLGVSRLRTKDKVNNDPASRPKAVVHPSPPSHPTVTRGRKRGPSELSEFDADSVDEVAEASSSSCPRTCSPSPSSAPRIPIPHRSTSPKPHERRGVAQPPTGSMDRKGTSSGVLTVTRRGDGTKEVRRKGSVVRNGSKGCKKVVKVEKNWWKTLGGSKK